MEISHEVTIGEMVAKDYRTATVFESFGIDFCCRGNHTFEEACGRKGLDPLKVQKVLDEFESDLHTHIHLENNILFPKSIEQEENLLRKLA